MLFAGLESVCTVKTLTLDLKMVAVPRSQFFTIRRLRTSQPENNMYFLKAVFFIDFVTLRGTLSLSRNATLSGPSLSPRG